MDILNSKKVFNILARYRMYRYLEYLVSCRGGGTVGPFGHNLGLDLVSIFLSYHLKNNLRK